MPSQMHPPSGAAAILGPEFQSGTGCSQTQGEKVLEEGKGGAEGRGFPGLEADSGDGKVSSICPLLPGVLV